MHDEKKPHNPQPAQQRYLCPQNSHIHKPHINNQNIETTNPTTRNTDHKPQYNKP